MQGGCVPVAAGGLLAAAVALFIPLDYARVAVGGHAGVKSGWPGSWSVHGLAILPVRIKYGECLACVLNRTYSRICARSVCMPGTYQLMHWALSFLDLLLASSVGSPCCLGHADTSKAFLLQQHFACCTLFVRHTQFGAQVL